ncbi:AAA family ATPase [Thalassotalea crassostreae]|uniref:AAA family ATPase n=1 Tax=Thalassotalea crassostreae TaxID=1763536 RepID=UPI000838539C|nr:AAA family ATPase [Thalassotalea crassostreae]
MNYTKDLNVPANINLYERRIELEQAILGCLMIDNGILPIVRKAVKPECFYHSSNRNIFKAICNAIDEDIAVDLTTIETVLNDAEVIVDNPIAYLGSIMKRVYVANIESYSKLLFKYYADERKRTDLLCAADGDEKALKRIRSGFHDQLDYQSGGIKYAASFEGYDAKVDYLIKKVIPADAFGMLYSGPGEFKSFLAISWACHVATGIKWNGLKVNQSGVLYIAGEGGVGIPRRIKAWSDQYYQGNEIPNLFRINQAVHLADGDQSFELLQVIERIKIDTGVDIKFIIVDTLARCFVGEENSATQMGAFIRGCDHVKQKTGATFLIVHHTGKDETKGARGSSSLKGACDYEFKIKRPNKDSGGMAINLSNPKMKDDETNETVGFTLTKSHLYFDEEDDEISSLVLNDKSHEPVHENEIDDSLTSNQRIMMNTIKSNLDDNEEVYYKTIREQLKSDDIPHSIYHNAKRLINNLCENDFIEYNHETGRIKLAKTH